MSTRTKTGFIAVNGLEVEVFVEVGVVQDGWLGVVVMDNQVPEDAERIKEWIRPFINKRMCRIRGEPAEVTTSIGDIVFTDRIGDLYLFQGRGFRKGWLTEE